MGQQVQSVADSWPFCAKLYCDVQQVVHLDMCILHACVLDNRTRYVYTMVLVLKVQQKEHQVAMSQMAHTT